MAAIGLKNIVVAKITKDDETGTVYETPRKLSPAMNVNITPTVNSANLPGDDQVQETIEELESVTVSFGVNEIDNEDYAYIMGKTVDANNGVTDKSTDEAPYLAFGYEAPLTGGRKRMTWLYKGKFGLPTEELQTKQGSPSFQTPTVEGHLFLVNQIVNGVTVLNRMKQIKLLSMDGLMQYKKNQLLHLKFNFKNLESA